MSTFHEGELAVQQLAGVQHMAKRVGKMIRSSIPPEVDDFLAAQPLIMVASRHPNGQVWASLLTGEAGFMGVLDENTVQIRAKPSPTDPLAQVLIPNTPIGLLAIEFATRQRIRLNGRFQRATTDSLIIAIEQYYGNCPKYIQARVMLEHDETTSASTTQSASLTEAQQDWIARADTLFLASHHADGGADISHRGGQAGFVRVGHDRLLTIPDYSGNTMFNTLGNLHANPSSGLLFVDFETGSTLQLAGQSTIVWDAERIAQFKGAERLIDFTIEQVIETHHPHRFSFSQPHYSPHNPV